MGMPLLHTDWTAAQALALSDNDNRYEVLDGELVVMPPPSWAHQVAVEQLYLALHPYVREQALGWVMLSPSTARRDRWQKRHMYQAFGTAEYWIVDPHARLVERWCPGDERPEVCSDTLTWAPPGARAPLRIDLTLLFAVVAGERE